MSRASVFREAVECACDDAHLTVIEIGSILIDLGHKYLGYASCDTLPKGQDAKQGLAGTEGSAVGATSAETPKV